MLPCRLAVTVRRSRCAPEAARRQRLEVGKSGWRLTALQSAGRAVVRRVRAFAPVPARTSVPSRGTGAEPPLDDRKPPAGASHPGGLLPANRPETPPGARIPGRARTGLPFPAGRPTDLPSAETAAAGALVQE